MLPGAVLQGAGNGGAQHRTRRQRRPCSHRQGHSDGERILRHGARALPGARRQGRPDRCEHVLAHVLDIDDFVGGIRTLLKPHGVATPEFPHLMRLIDDNLFGTIYHELFSYLSFTIVKKVFAARGLTVFDVEEVPTHGGSLRIRVQHQENDARQIGERVQDWLRLGRDRGLQGVEVYQPFRQKVAEAKRRLQSFLIDTRNRGKSIAGYGAPGKGNTLLNYRGIGTDFLDYAVDRNPTKQGNYLPGTRILIHPPEHIRHTKPDFLLILPWNLEDEIIAKNGHIRDWGGQFVVPIPETMIYS